MNDGKKGGTAQNHYDPVLPSNQPGLSLAPVSHGNSVQAE